MTRQVYADNVDANGKVFETVGENIRKGARAGELLNYKEILEKIDVLDPKISTLQADVTENKQGIKKNTADISVLNDSLVKETARAEQEEKRIEALFTNDVESSVDKWLNGHPEATTTVQDSSIEEIKFTDKLKTKAIKDYVTPEMYGAKGDYSTDDTQAVQLAFDSGYNVMLVGGYVCNSTVTVNNAKQRTITGFNINKSALLFKDNAQLIIGSTSNVNELRINNMSVIGDGTQNSVLKIQNVTNVYLNQVSISEGGTYLLELDHANIVYMDKCILAGSNKQNIWQPCAGVKLTSSNPIYVSQCNIWNVTNAFEIKGTTRTINLIRNWIEFVKRVVYATNIQMANCNIEVSQNNIVFSIHGDISHLDSRIVMLDTITTGFDIAINVNDNFINYYTTHPTEAIVEIKNVPSYVNVNILRNNMLTRLQQMNAYALKVDTRGDTKLNYESNTNADKDYGCSTNSVINRIVTPTSQTIKNLNLLSDQRQAVKYIGDLWFENEWLYIEGSVGTRSVVISQGETITNIEDASTASIEAVATKLNELMTALRKTKIVR